MHEKSPIVLCRRCLKGALIDDTPSNFNESGVGRIYHHRPDRHQKFMEEGPESVPESLCPLIYEPVAGINSCEIPRAFTAGRIRLETLTGRGPALISFFMEAKRHLLATECLFAFLTDNARDF